MPVRIDSYFKPAFWGSPSYDCAFCNQFLSADFSLIKPKLLVSCGCLKITWSILQARCMNRNASANFQDGQLYSYFHCCPTSQSWIVSSYYPKLSHSISSIIWVVSEIIVGYVMRGICQEVKPILQGQVFNYFITFIQYISKQPKSMLLISKLNKIISRFTHLSKNMLLNWIQGFKEIYQK